MRYFRASDEAFLFSHKLCHTDNKKDRRFLHPRSSQLGASLGCDGKSLRNLQTVSINRKSTHGKNNEKSCTLHSATGYARLYTFSPALFALFVYLDN